MKTKKNTAGLILFICTTLALGYCAKKKEDPADTGDTMADAEAVRQAKNTLEIGYAQGDSATSVTENITLPTEAENGVEIAWTSSNDTVIDVGDPGTGRVARPENANAEVTLFAVLTKNAAFATQTFTLTVVITDAGAVTQAMQDLEIGYVDGDYAGRVTENVTLPLMGANGVAINWASSHPGIISTGGVVTRPDDMTTEVILTATLTKNAARDTQRFTLTVLITEDAQAVIRAKDALTITYAQGDSASGVAADITLPTTGAGGVAISWASDNRAVINLPPPPPPTSLSQ